jgi:hypothetical protein
MIGEADYRNVTSEVRTPRFVVFIDENNPHWRTVVASLARLFSQTWGGKYFLIVPSDGKRIKDKYWELLEAYSPDHLGLYEMTLADLQEADPAQYEAIRDRLRKDWKFDQDFDPWFKEQQYHPTIGNFAIDAALQDELKNRLAPFHHDDHVVQKRLIRDHGLGFPFTEVRDINPHAHQPIKQLVLPKEVDDFDLRAMVLSQSGDLDEPTFHEYTSQQLSITTLPDNYDCEDMVEAVMMGAVDRFELGRTGDGERWRPDEDYVRHMPFQGSMLHLARYYRSDTHQDWLEPVVLVVGDTVEDFCLYYCLSRLHDGVFWLPKKWLDDCYRRYINNGRLYRKGRPTRDFSENARIARAIVQLAYKAIDYGHHEKRIEVRSASLSTDELRRTIRSMSRVSWAGGNGFARHATPKELSEPSTKCVARVIEENNYMNQQEMVFIGRKSVGRLATPKPKNFSLIHPARHWWLTSLHISEYTPPALSFLGKQIALTFESRVARDGVVYLCPSIGFFGGDIDVNLTRPQLVMVPGFDMMRQYLGEAGLEIQPSDKGNYLTDTISRFGDLAAAATFIRDPRTRAILDLFLIEQSAEDGHVVYLQEERRAVISYAGVSKCVGPDAAQVIDALVGKDILKRGLALLCNRCRLASWYDLATLTKDFTCRRCGQTQQVTKTNWKFPEEPRWYYALAETVYQCYTHNSYLTILALDHLRARSKASFEYLPEIDVLDFPSQGEKHEIDIACLVDNLVVIGECKTEPLRPRDAGKYETLAGMLGKRPDEIVFATSLDQVSEAFQGKVRGIPGASVLTADDLITKSP